MCEGYASHTVVETAHALANAVNERTGDVLAWLDDDHVDQVTTASHPQIEGAWQISMRALALVERQRSAYWRQFGDFLSAYDCLLMPACAQPVSGAH